MQDYQLRVIEEKKQLDEKCKKLAVFISDGEDDKSDVYKKLSSAEQELLVRQHRIMSQYSEVLQLRIELFKE